MAGDQPVEYLMSFVTGGLFYREALAVAALHQHGEAWSGTSVRAFDAGAFPVRKASSARRSICEITHRLKRLQPRARGVRQATVNYAASDRHAAFCIGHRLGYRCAGGLASHQAERRVRYGF